jgi:hypothetical protein
MSRRTAFPLGSEMWKKELSDHHKRLTTVKPTLPGPSAPSSGRPTTNSGRRVAGTSMKPRLGSPDTKVSGRSQQTAADAPDKLAAAKGMRIEELPTEDQRTCEAMMSVLQKLNTTDAKSILEELFVGCEMKRLLSQYTGVYPQPTGADDADTSSPRRGSDAALVERDAASPDQPHDNASSPLASEVSPKKGAKKHQSPPPSASVKSNNSTFNSSYASEVSSPPAAAASPRKESGASVVSSRGDAPRNDDEYGNESFE